MIEAEVPRLRGSKLAARSSTVVFARSAADELAQRRANATDMADFGAKSNSRPLRSGRGREFGLWGPDESLSVRAQLFACSPSHDKNGDNNN